jgi:hypothetical protein
MESFLPSEVPKTGRTFRFRFLRMSTVRPLFINGAQLVELDFLCGGRFALRFMENPSKAAKTEWCAQFQLTFSEVSHVEFDISFASDKAPTLIRVSTRLQNLMRRSEANSENNLTLSAITLRFTEGTIKLRASSAVVQLQMRFKVVQWLGR